LLLRDFLPAHGGLGIHQCLDLFQHLAARDTVRQLVYDDAPLAARERLDMPARAHGDRPAAGLVGLPDLRRIRNDLSAAREIRAGQQREHLVDVRLGVPDDE